MENVYQDARLRQAAGHTTPATGTGGPLPVPGQRSLVADNAGMMLAHRVDVDAADSAQMGQGQVAPLNSGANAQSSPGTGTSLGNNDGTQDSPDESDESADTTRPALTDPLVDDDDGTNA